MADRVSASIMLGGMIDTAAFAELAELIGQEGLSIDWDGEPFTPEDISPDKPLHLRAHEVAWGRFDELETWCIAQVRGKSDELLATGKVAFSHYMGALLLIPDADPVFGRIQAFNVVDGQQRLTTFHLCFAALRDLAKHHSEAATAAQLSDLILHNASVPMRDPATERYKLEPTAYDRALFRDLIDLDRSSLRSKYPTSFYKNGKINPSAPEAMAAYWFFWESADAYVSQDHALDRTQPDSAAAIGRRLLALSTVLFEHFRLIVITLSSDDDAQVIFETLNSGGKPLAAMDLVRNDVFHRAAKRGEDQEALLERFWSVFEKPFWKFEAVQGRIRKPRIDFFLAHALAAEQGKSVALGELFAEYKAFVAVAKFPDTATELAALATYAPKYAVLIEPSGDSALARLARRLAAFDVSTAYPLVLTIANSEASAEEKDRLFELIAGYVVRRAICYLPTANYNNIFVDIVGYLKREGVSEATLARYFENKAGDTVRFPDNTEFEAAIRTRPQYGWLAQPRIRLILEELEFAARDKFNINGNLQDGLSIEHVMPQRWAAYWPLPSGVSAPPEGAAIVDEAVRAEVQQREAVINSLPNLTLLTPAANSSASNSGFDLKRVRLNDSLLKTNVAIAAEPVWDEGAVARRADRIVILASRLWPTPRDPTKLP